MDDGRPQGDPEGPLDPATSGSASPRDVPASPRDVPASPRDVPASPRDVPEETTEAAERPVEDRRAQDLTPAASGGRRWWGRRRVAGKARRKAPWWELPALIVLAILIAIGVKTWIIQPFYIPSASMEHTLHGCPGCEGDRILVSKLSYDFGNDPSGGDIVVFNAPKGWDDEPASTPPSNVLLRGIRGFGQLIGFVPPDGEILVKRVIATGGQTVKGDAQGHVMISDDGPQGHFRTLVEPYVYNDSQDSEQAQAFGPVTVPKGRLWVMGDHRTNSADSRYHCSPDGSESRTDDTDCDPTTSTVPVSDVIGKAVVIAWPPSRWTTLGTPKTFDSSAQSAVVQGGAPILGVLPIYLYRRRSRRRP